jgi:hypothetical protein
MHELYTDPPGLSSSYVPEGQAQDGTEYTYDPIHVYIEGSPVENQGPIHWKPIGRSMTAQRHVLSPSSILPPLSFHCTFIVARKNLPRV